MWRCKRGYISTPVFETTPKMPEEECPLIFSTQRKALRASTKVLSKTSQLLTYWVEALRLGACQRALLTAKHRFKSWKNEESKIGRKLSKLAKSWKQEFEVKWKRELYLQSDGYNFFSLKQKIELHLYLVFM